MSPQTRQAVVLTALQNRQLLKAITGIANHNLALVKTMVNAANTVAIEDQAKVLALDVSAKPEIVQAVRAMTDLPVFASSVVPQELAEAIRLGADVAELGNYDALYEAGEFFTAEDVLALTRETLALLPESSLLSVTVPGHLSQNAQQQLAIALQALGVTMLQSEGAVRQLAASPQTAPLNASEKAAISFTNTALLARATRLPVIAASGIALNNIAQAFEAGASAVGVGRSVNQLANQAEMEKALYEMLQTVIAATETMAQAA